MLISEMDTVEDELEQIGGKGRSLSKMVRSGFSVPGGFFVTADAYRRFISENDLQVKILEKAKPALKDGYPVFEESSEAIRRLIMKARVSDELLSELEEVYTRQVGSDAPVAVRSSANAEDLPDLSFAGQQETFLNVRGGEALVESVQKCWSSLWTAQALSYRHQNGIDQGSVAMAVVVQEMVPSQVSGILFTANPATGDRSELIINSSFGLGEAVVSGQVTPDTYIVNRQDLIVKDTILGPKERQVVYDGNQGIRMDEVSPEERNLSSLSEAMITELCQVALNIESMYEGLPQDIEWAYSEGVLHLLQSRPITNLPVQPIEVDWIPAPPARLVSRRQIVENMPDPICPLFEELYLTRGLESARNGQSLMEGGGPMFVTVNGYAYQRFDWPAIIKEADRRKRLNEATHVVTEDEIEAAEYKAFMSQHSKHKQSAIDASGTDIELFVKDLNPEDKLAFDNWFSEQSEEDLAGSIVMPESENSTYIAFNHTAQNDAMLRSWYEGAKPRLEGVAEKWRGLDIKNAPDEELLDAIVEMGIEEGRYWTSDSSHTFGVAKSTDDQLQCFLRETLPEHNFISGQFLSGIDSKAMQANADLFEIAKLVRENRTLSYLVLVTPSAYLMSELRSSEKAKTVVSALDQYLLDYGHQGYSMDFIEPTQIEDPSALFATLKAMVRDKDYHPDQQAEKTASIRSQKLEEITELLSGLEYWQFRYRLWFARKYNYIREEVAFRFGYTWSILRPMAFELGGRLVEAGTFSQKEDIFFLLSEELVSAIKARQEGMSMPELGQLAAERRALREARKLHHPPGTLPPEASEIGGIAFKETQIKNDESESVMRGFPVSSGKITAKASVVVGPSEFDKMVPGSILVSPLTTPAWTQLFAHAVGLVTDVGSILAHGSIVAREYGIPAVLGVGDGTQRIKHGQTITIDGDKGTVEILEDGDSN